MTKGRLGVLYSAAVRAFRPGACGYYPASDNQLASLILGMQIPLVVLVGGILTVGGEKKHVTTPPCPTSRCKELAVERRKRNKFVRKWIEAGDASAMSR